MSQISILPYLFIRFQFVDFNESSVDVIQAIGEVDEVNRDEIIEPDEETFKTLKKKNRLIKMSLAAIETNYAEFEMIDDFNNLPQFLASKAPQEKTFAKSEAPSSCRDTGM